MFLAKPDDSQVFRSGPCQEKPLSMVNKIYPGKPLQRDHCPSDTSVPDEEVVTATDDETGYSPGIKPSNQLQQIMLILRDCEDIGRPSNLQ